MKDLKKYCKLWIDQNMCDGEDRREAHGDVVRMSSPDLYEMVDDMLEMYIEDNLEHYKTVLAHYDSLYILLQPYIQSNSKWTIIPPEESMRILREWDKSRVIK